MFSFWLVNYFFLAALIFAQRAFWNAESLALAAADRVFFFAGLAATVVVAALVALWLAQRNCCARFKAFLWAGDITNFLGAAGVVTEVAGAAGPPQMPDKEAIACSIEAISFSKPRMVASRWFLEAWSSFTAFETMM